MTKMLLTAAALAFGMTAASAACEYHKTVQASEPEKTVVASAAKTDLPPPQPSTNDEASKAEGGATETQ